MGFGPLLIVALLATGLDDKPAKIDPTLLVGVWEQVKDADEVPAGATTEFAANGQYHFLPKAKNISEYHSTYKVQGETITIESMNPGLIPSTEVSILELTPTKLILSMGGEREFRRKATNRAAGPRPGQRSGGLALGAPAPKASNGRWVVVNSREDGYRVEMPGSPNRESEEEGMGFAVRIKSYQGSNAEYAVLVNSAPVAFPKDKLDQACRQVCEKSAGRFGSDISITDEKPVRVGKVEGREYELIIQRPNIALGTARCRVIPLDKSAFALLVLPSKDEPIPAENTRKFFESFALGKNAPNDQANADAEPNSPRPRGGTNSARRGSGSLPSAREGGVVWGNEVNPEGDVQIRKNGSALSLAIPATAHLLAPERSIMNAPRVVMPVGGDFNVAVRVDGKFDPSDKSTVKGLSPRQSGGLIVWKDAKNYLVVQRRVSGGGDDRKDQNQVVLEELVNGAKGATIRQAVTTGSLYLRLDREGKQIKAATSPDGRRWVEIKPVEAAWAEGELEVGVVATNSSTTPHAVTFDNYKLMPR